MFRANLLALLTALVMMSGGLVGQDAKKDEKKPDDAKKVEPSAKVEKKDESPAKVKGTLPGKWKQVGLTDSQVQDIYKVQNKYNDEIDKLDAKIKELKATRDKEMKAVMTPDQRKRLDDILTGKDKDK